MRRVEPLKGQTERVDDTFVLLSYAIYAAHPLAAISALADAFDAMGALESRDVKVP
jgi:hypothetical protein